MTNRNIEPYIVPSGSTIREALKAMDAGGEGFICICHHDRVMGIATDGDFRRAILDGVDHDTAIDEIMNTRFQYLEEPDPEKVREIFANTVAREIPIIKSGKLLDIVFQEANT